MNEQKASQRVVDVKLVMNDIDLSPRIIASTLQLNVDLHMCYDFSQYVRIHEHALLAIYLKPDRLQSRITYDIPTLNI